MSTAGLAYTAVFHCRNFPGWGMRSFLHAVFFEQPRQPAASQQHPCYPSAVVVLYCIVRRRRGLFALFEKDKDKDKDVPRSQERRQ